MTIVKIMQPFTIFFDWMRTYQIHLGEFTFTFMDWFVWQLFASIVIGVIIKFREG